MYGKLQADLQKELKNIEEAGLYKKERIITTPMGAEVKAVSYTHLTLPTIYSV